MYRQGDVLLVQTQSPVPEGAWRLPACTLAHGERSGHSHRVLAGAEYFSNGHGEAYLSVTGSFADLVHEEHATIRLPGPAVYRVQLQVEYLADTLTPVAVED